MDSDTELLTTINTDNNFVAGMALLNKKLYVLTNMSRTIRVYTAIQPYKHISDIPAEPIQEVVDMVASVVSNCLYVSDSGKKCVWKVLTSGSLEVSQWLSKYSSQKCLII